MSLNKLRAGKSTSLGTADHKLAYNNPEIERSRSGSREKEGKIKIEVGRSRDKGEIEIGREK
jgi:hypothetical protein